MCVYTAVCSVCSVSVCHCCCSIREESEGCAYDQQSSSVIRLNNGTILYLREVNR